MAEEGRVPDVCGTAMLTYEIGTSGQSLRLNKAVLDHFDAYRQLLPGSREAGGHLFARVEGSHIEIVHASGPEPKDLRSRLVFAFRKKAAQRIIDARFAKGEHYVGDWHTHPEDIPSPSGIDQTTMASRFKHSDHGLQSMIFCIVGRRPFPEGLALIVHNGVLGVRLASASR